MAAHKRQAQSGPVNVNFSIACVSYNLFQQVHCNYHDPFNENVPYDNVSLAALTRKYYRGLLGFLNQKLFEYREVEIQGERFYEIDLFYRNLRKGFPDEFPFWPWHFELHEFFRPRLLLPFEIRSFADNGITNSINPFIFESSESDTSTYIDNDRVGLRIRHFKIITPKIN